MREELQSLAQSLATRVARPVAVDDPQMNLLVHTPHDGPLDPARLDSLVRRQPPPDVVAWALRHGIARASGAVRLPPWPDRELLARVCAPARADGLLLGFVWLIDAEQSLTEDELRVVEEVAAAVGAVLARARRVDDEERAAARALLRALLDGDRTAAQRLRAQALDVEADAAVAVLVVRGPSAEDVERAARRLPPRTWVADGETLLVAGRRAVEDLRRSAGQLPVRCAGIGDPGSLEEAATSAKQARFALRVADAVPETGPVAVWQELGVYQLLAQLPDDAVDAVPPALRRLFAADTSGQLVETLETWLDHGGDARSTVEALNVHRTSLYYRLARMEELADLRLSDGSQRLAVHLGLKLARLTRQHPATPVEDRPVDRRQEAAAPRRTSP